MQKMSYVAEKYSVRGKQVSDQIFKKRKNEKSVKTMVALPESLIRCHQKSNPQSTETLKN